VAFPKFEILCIDKTSKKQYSVEYVLGKYALRCRLAHWKDCFQEIADIRFKEINLFPHEEKKNEKSSN
jgi:hypothetical protein